MKNILDINPISFKNNFLNDFVALNAVNHPQRLALSDSSGEVNYEELDHLINCYAHILFSKFQIQPQQKICLYGNKSIHTVVIILAIWKIGAICCPVDSKSGEKKLDQIINLLQPDHILNTTKNNLTDTTHFIIDTLQFSITSEKHIGSFNSYLFKDTDLMYIIYTSGTTGIAKGVMINANSFKHYACAHQKWLKFTFNSSIISLTPIHFDVFFEDTIIPLMSAAHVYQYDSLYTNKYLTKVFLNFKPSHIIAVSSILNILSSSKNLVSKKYFPNLSMVMTGAESCPVSLFNLWKLNFPDCRVINAYGPTETTIVSHCYEIEVPHVDLNNTYPIGQPLDGIDCLLINEDNHIVSDLHTPGELLIAGPQVMAGYLNDEILTSQVMTSINGQQYYHTGDICIRDEQQNYIFIERKDFQIKLNGVRLNLGELHMFILNNFPIKQCALGLVIHNGSTILGCTISSLTPEILTPLIKAIKQNFDHILVPHIWGVSQKTYLNQNGKSDNKLFFKEFQNNLNDSSTIFHF